MRSIQRSWFSLLAVGQLLQNRAEADASLAYKRGGFRDRALLGVGTGEADPDLVAAEHRALALARRVLMIDEFAFPFAVRTGAGADIIEERIAAAHSAILQHHDAGVTAVDAVHHPDVHRIVAVPDASFSWRAGGRRRLLADRSHQRVEGNAG